MTVSEKEDDPASFLVKGFPSWSQWDQLQLIFGAQGKIVPVILGSIVGSTGSELTDLLLSLQRNYFWCS